jgi:hypothetical protein
MRSITPAGLRRSSGPQVMACTRIEAGRAIYEARRHIEEAIRIDWSQEVHAALSESFLEWILLEWLQAHGG